MPILRLFTVPFATASRFSSEMAASLRLITAFLTILILPAESGFAAPGDLDPAFNPNIIGDLRATAVQPDGRVLIAGNFTSVAGAPRRALARLHADGSVDETFTPFINAGLGNIFVSLVVVQLDGKILIGGFFPAERPDLFRYLARLNPDGTLDASFSSDFPVALSGMAVQPDGKIVIFHSESIRRFNADGSPDPGFYVGANGFVDCLTVQNDGKILLGGTFTSVAGVPRNYLARLEVDGSVDMAFDPNAGGSVHTVAVQADGYIVVGGGFTSMSGSARNRLARISPAGALDGFDPNSNGPVYSMTVQADGKILVTGDFTGIGGGNRPYAARLNANGTLDNEFSSMANSPAWNVVLQADGRVLVWGFNAAGKLVRGDNNPATESVTVPAANRIEWLRDGSAPEVVRVSFELSEDGGISYSQLGSGTRIAGGWEKTGLSLPANGEIRARGMSQGQGNASGVVEKLAAFGSPAPEIAVQRPEGTDMAAGSSDSFGSHGIGDSPVLHTFTIRNTGNASLTGLTISKDGPDANLFSVIAKPVVTVPGGGATTFTVSFAALSTGEKTAALHISSNDSNESPFDISLTGTGVLSSNADLAALTMRTGAVTPLFASGITHYTPTVGSDTDQTTVIPTTSSTAAMVFIRGERVTSGTASPYIQLNVGETIIPVMVTAGDGITSKTYTITITRPAPGTGTGDVDTTFDPPLTFRDGNNNLVRLSISHTVLQPDGKLIVLGTFTSVDEVRRDMLTRLNADGTQDSTFHTRVASEFGLQQVAVLPDGKLLVVGEITGADGITRRCFRLHADGTLDDSFLSDPNLYPGALAIQPDGKILTTSGYDAGGKNVELGLSRLNPDGTFDFRLNLNAGISTMAVQPDGKIVIGGPLSSVYGVPRRGMARLNADGSLDTGFNPDVNGDVACVVLQPDGKILLNGHFSGVGDIPRKGIARINPDGSLDHSFQLPTPAHDIYWGRFETLALQTDGKVLIGSGVDFQGFGRYFTMRLHPDGTRDAAFDTTVALQNDARIGSVALQADGKVIVGGGFPWIGGEVRPGFARLLNEPATRALTVVSADRVQWLRGGTSPEVSYVTFELSTDEGNTYALLGAATRMAGGWEKTGLSLPPNGKIRARARTTSGWNNGSLGLIEQVAAFTLALTPLQQWKFDQLGDAVAPDLGDPDRDGIVTLAEYGLNLLPTGADGAPLTATRFDYSEGNRMRVFVQRNPAHNDVTVEVQAGHDLDGPWTALATSTNGAPFAGSGYVGGDSATPGVKTVEIRDIVNIAAAPARFVRVRVTR